MKFYKNHVLSLMAFGIFTLIALSSEDLIFIPEESGLKCCRFPAKTLTRTIIINVSDITNVGTTVPAEGVTVTYSIISNDLLNEGSEPPCPCDNVNKSKESGSAITGPDGQIVLGERTWVLNSPEEHVIIFAEAQKEGYSTDKGRQGFFYTVRFNDDATIRLYIINRSEL